VNIRTCHKELDFEYKAVS